MAKTGKSDEGASADAVLSDYAELLERGFCIPSWASGHFELNAVEKAWIDALEKQAAIDGIRITHSWEQEPRGERWNLIATIAPRRHDQNYGLPRPHSNTHWRERFERDWGQTLQTARGRVATERGTPTTTRR